MADKKAENIPKGPLLKKWKPSKEVLEEFTPLIIQEMKRENELKESIRLKMLEDMQKLEDDEIAQAGRKYET